MKKKVQSLVLGLSFLISSGLVIAAEENQGLLTRFCARVSPQRRINFIQDKKMSSISWPYEEGNIEIINNSQWLIPKLNLLNPNVNEQEEEDVNVKDELARERKG